ncbi:MAG: glycosyltransferase [Candidatus Omnitrophica bacterium]|nr:glycosyltransferase [Candidatus Omnitrophota bacterium]
MNSFLDLKVLISGQLITSRTETLEEYFKDRVTTLIVIGITSPFAPKNISRCSLYNKGRLQKEFNLPGFQIHNMRWYKQPLLFISFCIYIVSLLYAMLRLRGKFDIFIGISCFSAFMGVLFKKLGWVKRIIYYSIDYYPSPSRFNFDRFVVWLFRRIDKFCVKNADLVWNISPKIAEARYRYTRLSSDRYKHIVVPLTYSSKFLRFKPIEEIERYTIGFVGTLSENQGLQLLIKAMPKIIKEIPQIKVRIIGKGPYEEALKKMVSDLSLDNYFIFHGFIKDNNDVLEILSKCAVGIAIWTCEEDDNILYADPGKPKLYAFCGLPIIITDGAMVAKEIEQNKAGMSIAYNEDYLIKTLVSIIKDNGKLKEYKECAFKWAKKYTTDGILSNILKDGEYLN